MKDVKEVTDWILEKPRAGLCIPGCTTGVSIAAGSLASHWKDRFQCPECPRWHAHAQGVVLDDDDGGGGGGGNDVTGRPAAARKEMPEALLVRTTPSALGCTGASKSVPRDVVTPEDSVDDGDDDGAVGVNTSSLSSTAAEEEEGEEEEEAVGGSSTTSSSCKVKTT